MDFTDYVYNADEDENAKGWFPIGHDTNKDNNSFDGTQFSGTFDGGGHVIRNLMISRADEDYVGVFGAFTGTVIIKNLGVEGVSVEGKDHVGGLVGGLAGAITSCYAKGQVRGMAFVGGLLGSTDGGGVKWSYSTSAVTGSTRVGGFVGLSDAEEITSCYSTGRVTGSGELVGGFIGQSTETITSCYSTGAVTGGSSPGGFAGTNDGTVSNSFWDTGTSGIMTGDVGTGKTTAEMKGLTTGAFGANDSDWDFGDSTQYPALKKDGTVVAGQPCPRVECDPLVSIAAGSSPVTEGTAAEFTFTRTGFTARELTVAIMVTGGDGFLSGTPPTEVTFGAGEAMKVLSLVTAGDEVDEADGTITVTITPDASRFRLENASASIMIIDNDAPEVSITAAAASVTEGTDAVAVFTVSRPAWDVSADLVVSLTVDGGTADFLSPGENLTPTVTIPLGETSVDFEFEIVDDEVDEADGTLTVTVSPMPSVYTLSGSVSAMVAVADDDFSEVSITAAAASVTEGTDAAAAFTVSRPAWDVSADLVVSLTVDGGTADFLDSSEDLTPTVTIPAGETSVDFEVGIVDDGADEADGTLTVTVSPMPSVYTLSGSVSAMVAVADDDFSEVSITAAAASVTEGPGAVAAFTVSRPAWDVSEDLVISLTVDGGTADFLDSSEDLTPTVTITAGETSVDFEVGIVDDGADEADGTLTVTVSPMPSVYTLSGSVSAMVAVADDDFSEVSITAAAASVTEGTDAAAAFTVSRPAWDVSADLVVSLTVDGGTADFLDPSEDLTPTVTITAGETSVDFEVGIVDDGADEADGTLTVTVSPMPSVYTLSGSVSAMVAVADDDFSEVSITAAAASVTEGPGAVAAFTVSRPAWDVSEDLVISLTVDGGTADFLDPSEDLTPTVTITAGETSVDFEVGIVDDGADEADGTLTVTVSPMPSVYTLSGSVSAMVAVADDDFSEVSITAAAASVTEGTDAAAAFTVSRPAWDVSADLVVSLTVDGGTADFLDPSEDLTPTVTITAGETSVDFEVGIVDDEADEADGTLTVTVSPMPSVYTLSGSVSAMVAVVDDELPVVSIIKTTDAQEGVSGMAVSAVFTVSRVGLFTSPLDVKVGLIFSEDFSSSAGTETMVTIAANETTATLEVGVTDNDMDQADGTITATLSAVAPATYEIGSSMSATVSIEDDDFPSITSFVVGDSSSSVINEEAKTITVSVPYDTVLTGVIPMVVTVRSDATVTPLGLQTFVVDASVAYTVMAGGDTVMYQVTVVEEAGDPPGVPVGFSVVAGLEEVTLSWQQPSELGTTGLLSRYEYRQTRGVMVSGWARVVPPTATTQVVGGLTAGAVYGFEVRAVASRGLVGAATTKIEATPLAVPLLTFGGETIAAQTYTANTVVAALELPEAMGGKGTLTYTLTPTLPGGLSFDPNTRMLTGTPDTGDASTIRYAYTVRDTSGNEAILSFTIKVDYEATLVSITGSGVSVLEGVDTEFTITRMTVTPEPLAVRVTLSAAEGDYLTTPLEVTEGDDTSLLPLVSGSMGTVTIAGGQAIQTFKVSTQDDATDEADGLIEATVLAELDGPYYVDGTDSSILTVSATAVVLDNDLPLVSITRTTDAKEGSGVLAVSAVFTVTRVGLTLDPLDVKVGLVFSDGFLSSAGQVTLEMAVTIGATMSSATLVVGVLDNDVDQVDGTLTATLSAVAPATYEIGLSMSATASIEDDDLPVVFATAGSLSVVEGDTMVFTLIRVGSTATSLTVSLLVTGDTDFVSGPLPTQAVFGFNEAETTLRILTLDDAVDEVDGIITVSVSAATDDYLAGAGGAAEMTVLDNDLPAVSVVLAALPVLEGEDVAFTLTRVGATAGRLTVGLEVTGDTDFVTGPLPTEAVFGFNEATTTLLIATGDNELDEADGMIRVTLTAGSDYVLSDMVSGTVAVKDNDLPSITSFELGGVLAQIDERTNPKTITVTVSGGTSLAGITPVVTTVRSDAALSPPGAVTFLAGRATAFSVSAGGDEVTYQVTVEVAGSPTGLTVSSVSMRTTLELGWASPSDTSGATILGYKIERSADGMTGWREVLADTGTTDTFYSHEGLSVGETIHYRVSAITTIGTSVPSGVAWGTVGSAPTVTFGEPDLTAVGVTAPMTPNMRGRIHYVVLGTSDPAPMDLAGVMGSRNWAFAGVVTVGVPQRVEVSGLEALTDYVLYAVLSDGDNMPLASAPVSQLRFRTAAAPTVTFGEPVPTAVGFRVDVTSNVAGRLHYVVVEQGGIVPEDLDGVLTLSGTDRLSVAIDTPGVSQSIGNSFGSDGFDALRGVRGSVGFRRRGLGGSRGFRATFHDGGGAHGNLWRAGSHGGRVSCGGDFERCGSNPLRSCGAGR